MTFEETKKSKVIESVQNKSVFFDKHKSVFFPHSSNRRERRVMKPLNDKKNAVKLTSE